MSRGDMYPYKPLGRQLKNLREKKRETLAEVSGAVEIDMEALDKIEQGSHIPSEDILLLLISHFEVKEEEATKLWELAQYDKQGLPLRDAQNAGERPTVVMSPEEARIAYTDMVHVTANNYGVVVNFMQGNGPSGQPLIVSRVGMSKEHAQSLIEVLQKTITASEPKKLPAPEATEDKQSKN